MMFQCSNRLSATAVAACLFQTSFNVHAQVIGPDFNNDGFADMAIGTPDEDLPGLPNAGIVHVLPGSSGGLTVAGHSIWNAELSGGMNQDHAIFGNAMGWGDLNGDGFDDLVIAARDESINGMPDAGAMYVVLGSANGLTTVGSAHWHQDVPGVASAAEVDDEFGFAIVVGDFDNDGFGDIAVSAPGEAVGATTLTGVVHIFYGSPSGPTTSGSQLWYQNAPGVRGVSGVGDLFGAALSVGDFNGDDFDDLAIGVPGETVNGAANAGAVNVLYGSPQGLNTAGNQVWTQLSSGIIGGPTVGDLFGRSLAAGDYNGDGFEDLAIGISEKTTGGAIKAGALSIIFGTANGLRSAGNQYWNAGASGLTNSPGENHMFAWKLTSGDFNNDGKDDLAIGIPNQTISGSTRAGAVQVLLGRSSGLTSVGARLFHQNTSGIAGVAEEADRFGYAVAARDFNGDGFADLAIGAPYEAVGSVIEAGMLHVLFGGPSGLTVAGDQMFTQSTPGINGEEPEPGDEFADYF